MHKPWLRGAGDILSELFTSITLKMNIEVHFDFFLNIGFWNLIGPNWPETTVKGFWQHIEVNLV